MIPNLFLFLVHKGEGRLDKTIDQTQKQERNIMAIQGGNKIITVPALEVDSIPLNKVSKDTPKGKLKAPSL